MYILFTALLLTFSTQCSEIQSLAQFQDALRFQRDFFAAETVRIPTIEELETHTTKLRQQNKNDVLAIFPGLTENLPLLDKRKYSIRQQGECTSLVTFLTTLKQLQEKRTAFENHLSHFFTEKPTASSIDIVSTFINCNDELFQPYETLHRKTVLARKSPTETLLTALLFPELTFTNTKDVNVIFNNSNVTQPVNIAQEDTPSLERIAQVFRTLNKVLEAKGTLKAAVIASDTQRIETAYANLWEANAELKKAELFAFSQSSVLLSTRLQRSLCAALPERIKDVKTIEVYERL